MKNKRKIIVIIGLIIGIIFVMVGTITLNSDKDKVKYNDVCRQIDKAKTNQKDFIVVINNHDVLTDFVFQMKEKYRRLNIIEINEQKMKYECLGTSLEDTGEYERLLNDKNSTIIGYKNGVYEGLISGNQSSFETVEKYLNELKIIEIPKAGNTITYEEYEQNKKLDEYFVIIISNEEARKHVEVDFSKVFSGKKYDVVNKESEEGTKILKDIKSKVKVSSYPKLFYFKKGELLLNESCISEMYMEQIKTKISKLD